MHFDVLANTRSEDHEIEENAEASPSLSQEARDNGKNKLRFTLQCLFQVIDSSI